ncbi:hypothetical protein [Microbacterium binotii]|uniref:hypothetical protein n=1 Tax=Microbacterium binotii TaxID=462710 RepID=UPI001F2E1988|nr:hypothetical protein [Microbacterium binotii]UIN31287.1 hypothetical protein LXM64_03525 [Microbacterium binotii]
MAKPDNKYDRRQPRTNKTRRAKDRKARRDQAYFRKRSLAAGPRELHPTERVKTKATAQLWRAGEGDGVGAEHMKRIHEISDFQEEAGSVEFDSGEYLEWERHPNTIRLAWSSRTGLSDSIRAFRKQFGSEDIHHEGLVIFDDETSSVRPAPEIARLALAEADEISFYRVDYDRAAVAWNPATPGAEAARFPETMLAVEPGDLGRSLDLIHRTATPLVKLLARRAVSSILESSR